jgi:hypothetical protein
MTWAVGPQLAVTDLEQVDKDEHDFFMQRALGDFPQARE